MAKNRTRRNTYRRRQQRQNAMRQNMMGGALQLTPMELKDTSMVGPSKQSIEQGVDFFGYHSKQHGGAAPVGTTGVLDESLRGYARLAPLDRAYSDIAGLRDQAGGRRRRRGGRKGRKATRKGRKGTRKGRKGRKGTRKMRGGMRELGSMPVDAPGMLLPPALGRAALSTMNQEWKLAEDPKAFAPM